jgi:hypothetical protein
LKAKGGKGKMAEKTTIRKALLKLAAIFPEKKLEAEGIDVYCEMLKDIGDEQLNNSIKECLLTCKFFPSIAEIREKCSLKNSDAKISETFFKMIDMYYRSNKIIYPDANYARAFKAVGGLKEMTEIKNKDLQFIKKDFIAYYRDYERLEKLGQLKIDDGQLQSLLTEHIPYVP